MTPLRTPVEAARRIGCSVRHLRKLTRQGKIAFVDIGAGETRKRRRYADADIEAFMLARREVECPSTSAKAPKPIPMTSGSGVVDFQAIRDKWKSERQKPSSSSSATAPQQS